MPFLLKLSLNQFSMRQVSYNWHQRKYLSLESSKRGERHLQYFCLVLQHIDQLIHERSLLFNSQTS